MKTRATLFVLMCGVRSASMHGAAKTEDQPAIVVSVENHDPQSNSNYAGPLDLPLPPQIYSYDIAIPVGSTRYRTSYASAFDYLPAVFAAITRSRSISGIMGCMRPFRATVRCEYLSRVAAAFMGAPAYGLKLVFPMVQGVRLTVGLVRSVTLTESERREPPW